MKTAIKPTRLIGISGRARSGKDTTAKIIMRDHLLDFRRAAFADPLKEMLAVIGVDCSDEAKDVIDPYYGVTPRYMMQTLGTKWGRGMIGDNTWVKAFERRVKNCHVVAPDVRFENEADLVRKYGVMMHVVGRGGIDSDCESEKPIEIKPQDIVIDNSGSIYQLEREIYRALTGVEPPNGSFLSDITSVASIRGHFSGLG